MKRSQLQSLKAVVTGLTASVIALLPVVKILGYLFFTVFVFYLGVGVVLELTGYLLQPFGLPFITELISTSILDPFIEFIRQLPTIEGVSSEPEHGSQSEEMLWELLATAYNFLFMAMVVLMMLAALVFPIANSARSESGRIEPMSIEELEEHYESQYENGEITQEEHDERIEMVYEIKGLEDDNQ